jgi:DNA-binding SARP family transcriptional activator/predicted ATPase
VEVIKDGRVVALPRRKQRALLAVLLLRRGEAVSADRLIEELWGEAPPATARNSLQNTVSLLRKAVGAKIVVSRPAGYAVEAEADEVDLGRFERLTAEARDAASAQERATKLREALELWRGPPLADLAFEPFALLEAPRLEELRLAAQEELFDAELSLGRDALLVPELETAIEQHPFNERLRGQLMLCLYRAGRQADALEVFREARRFLVDELGLEPSEPLRDLERAIIRQDPVLATPAPAGAAAVTLPARKAATVLFCDLVDSSVLAEELDPELYRSILERWFAVARAALERHGGTIERFVGDAVMAVFGVPTAHEDDPLRAVRAAAELRTALERLGAQLQTEGRPRLAARIGVSTGGVFAGESATSQALVTGVAVNLAKRLEQSAAAGEILLGADTLRLVRHAVTAEAVEPVGSGEHRPVPAFRLLDVAADAPPIALSLEAPLVGRADELRRLHAAFARGREERRLVLVTLVGDPGIGKTRLARELADELADEATVLVGRCLSYGEGATWLPLADMLGQAGHDLADLQADGGSVGETFLAVRRLFETLAAARPLLLVFEDAHWAEPTLLDLIAYLVKQVAGAPILALCLARPELLEQREEWPGEMAALGRLPDEAAETLVGALEGDLPAELRARVVEAAGGNPLFAEQLVAYLREEGAERIAEVPPSVEALIQSRLDLLEPDQLAMLRRAAVAGREFPRAAVLELSPPEDAAALDTNLALVVRRGLVHPLAGDVFRFHHVLVRDVAYAMLPKAERVDLHETLADWLDEHGAAPDELVGYHLEQAHRHATELGSTDRRTRRLAADAGARLGAAGIEAWKLGDTPATVNLLGRATGLLPERDPFRLELLCELGMALRAAGELIHAQEVLSNAIAAASKERRLELRARLELANVRGLIHPQGQAQELVEMASTAIPVFEGVKDDRSLGRAWFLVASVEGSLHCRYQASAEAADRALAHYRSSGWSTAACLGELAAALYYGPSDVNEAIARSRGLLARADLGGKANVSPLLAELEAMRGNFETARRLIGEARSIYEQLGQPLLAESSCGMAAGDVELLAGDAAAAERALKAACEALGQMHDQAHLATGAAVLADALYEQGRYEEALDWSRLAESKGAADDVPTQFLWRAVRARLLARTGESAEAEALVREAIRLADTTDALNQRATLSLHLGEVLRLGGRLREASDAVEEAIRLFEEKGNVASLGRARSLLLELAPA